MEQTEAPRGLGAEFETRGRFVAFFIGGKHQAGQQIIIVLGLTVKGDKTPLGFVQADGESALAINDLWKNLLCNESLHAEFRSRVGPYHPRAGACKNARAEKLVAKDQYFRCQLP